MASMILRKLLNRVTRIAIFTLIFSQAAFAQADVNDNKIPPSLINLLQKSETLGESAILDHAKAHGIRFVQRTGQEALFPLMIDMKPGVSSANFDKSWLQSRSIMTDAESKSFIRVKVPLRLMRTLAQHPQIRSLRFPRRPIPLSIGLGTYVSESVHLTNADSLQQENLTGNAVKVAVLDMGFNGLQNTMNAGELPSSTAKILLPGQSTLENGINHGVAVSEQVMDMAPGASLYCIMVGDETDFENAVDTIRAKNIKIVNHSVGWALDGYYDDTGPIDSLVNFSHDKDSVFWAVASGNEAQRHWRGKWTDADHDSLLEFQTGAESLQIITSSLTDGNPVEVYLNWNQYTNTLTDLDLYVYDKNNKLIESSTYPQLSPPYYIPGEYVAFPCSSSQTPYKIKVKKKAGPVLADTFDITIFSPDADLLNATPGSSMMEPADAHGAFTVGAVSTNNWVLSSPAIEPFSSRGPTNDNRMKPDITAPDSTSTWTYLVSDPTVGAARGTSYSSPVVAGAAALFKQKYSGITMKMIADSLRAMVKSVGTTSADSAKFGAGLLYVYLPPPVLLSPSNNASGLTTSQTLTWSTVGNAATYHVQVSTDNGFSSIVNQDSTLTAGSKTFNGLTNGTTYYWRVRSKNSHGVSTWSGYWKFTIIKQFILTVSATNGTVTKSPTTSPYDSGTVVTLTPVPSAGYVFSSWSGDLTGTANPGSITMNAAKNITANFTIKQYALNITATNGTVTKSPSTGPYDSGTVVTLTPLPAVGYHFVSWSGDLTGTANPGSLVMTGVKNITANFAINTYALNITATNGAVSKSPNLTVYDSGTVVTLTPNPSPGYVFSSWSGDLTGTVNPGSITMNAAKNITANFTIKQFTLSITATNGTVTKSPSQTTYDSGTTVTLTPVPSTGYHFTSWSGDLTGTANPGSVVMTGAKNITAGFAITSYTVTASAGTGGIVKPSGSQTVNYGDTLRDTAVTNTGYTFVNWTVSGGVTTVANGAIGTFVVTGAGTVQANFSIKVYSLTTTAINGTVAKAPDQTVYDSGTSVTLTATPSTGYHFTTWTGDLASSTNPATIIMTAAKNITGNFAITAYSVTASAGAGGTVKPSGTQSINYNDTLKDTAIANPGYSFVNWTVTGGVATAVSGAAGKFVVAGAGTVQANFAIKTYSFSITSVNGTVTKSPDQTVYDSGTSVTLTAVPSTGYHFMSWSGDLTGTTNPAPIIMTSAKNVTAGFVINVPDSPVLASPANASVNAAISPVLTWNAAARAATYQVQVSTSALFADTVVRDTGLTVLSKSEGPLLNNTTYFWRVAAKNAGGTGAWSAVWSFTTIPAVPMQVQLLSPKDTAKIPADSVLLVWRKSVAGTDRYKLEIAADSLMTTMIYSDTTVIDTQKIYKGLSDKTTYWWHVLAHNVAGWGSAGAAFKFTVAIPSTAVLPKSFSFAMNGMWNSRYFISYALPAETKVSIRLYGIGGRLIATLCDATQEAGYYHIPIGQLKLSNGYYLLDFRAGKHVITKKLPLFR
jgi:hypothetical protein